MTPLEILALAGVFCVIAVCYSTVGHGGASGYLMVMGVVGLSAEVMKPTALILNLFVATVALIRFARVGGFHWRTLWPLVVTSLPCAFVGGAMQLDPAIYRRLVAVVLLFAAIRLATRIPGASRAEPVRIVPVWVGMLWGAAIGLLSGMVGVGGGIFLSPVLLVFAWATARQTAGVSAAFILINSIAGLAGFTARHQGLSVEPLATSVFAISVLMGGLLGTWIGTRRLGHVGLRRTLAVVLAVAGLKMLFVSPQGPSEVPADRSEDSYSRITPEERSMEHPGRTLRKAMDDHTVVAPGAFNALVARAVAAAGFEACYLSGAATANASGYPDIGLITLTEMCRTIREVTQSHALPTIVDADTGYGEVESVVRTVVEYERAGAAALHIEDQVFPKRCGHLEGKSLIGAGDMAEKVSAARDHRSANDFMIIARTDARSVNGLDDAIERANLYRTAGADAIFPEGLESEQEFADFAAASPGLLMANMTEFGKTPDIPAKRFAELGYQLVIYPVSLLRLAMGHVIRGLETLKEHGTMEVLKDEMQPREKLYELLDYRAGRQWNYPKKSQTP